MMQHSLVAGLAVACSALGDKRLAKELATELGVSVVVATDPRRVTSVPLLLTLNEQGLALQLTGKGAPGPVRVEFVSGKMAFRREHGGGTGQLVARAVGLHKTRTPLHVLDATAGLGQDAFILAGLGCRLTLFERHPVIHALLQDGLARAALNVECAPVIARMDLRSGSSLDFLSQTKTGEPKRALADVIYLDPMFPHQDKTALVKKEMQVFRHLVGQDEDTPQLLQLALNAARCRVVVKRPRKAPAIAGATPTTRVEGKSSRYDIYSLRALP